MDLTKFITETLTTLQPVIGLLVAILIAAVIYQARENGRLREERNKLAEKKDADLKEIAASKDADLKELTHKMIDLQEKTIVSNEKLANNISVNTEATKRVEMLISNYNAVLTSVKK